MVGTGISAIGAVLAAGTLSDETLDEASIAKTNGKGNGRDGRNGSNRSSSTVAGSCRNYRKW